MEKKFSILPLLASGILLTTSLNANAQVSTQMEVMATVGSQCAVDATPVDFGVYEGPEVNATGAITVDCNDGVPYLVGLNAGMNSDGANRMMSDDAGNTLPYRLTYIGAEWGDDGVTNSYQGASVAGTGSGSPTSFTVDAMIFPDMPAPPGVYTDTVTVTVAF
jgi:spore coat protein U-like protein